MQILFYCLILLASILYLNQEASAKPSYEPHIICAIPIIEPLEEIPMDTLEVVLPDFRIKHEQLVPHEMKDWTDYYLEQGSYRSSLETSIDRSGNLEFVLKIEDDAQGCLHELSGIAVAVDGDMESRDDPEGNTWFAQQYNYAGKNCSLYFLIDLEEGDRLWIEEADCEEAHLPKCPFGNVGVHVRVME